MRQWRLYLFVAVLNVNEVMFCLFVVVFASLCSHAVSLWGYFVLFCGTFFLFLSLNFASSLFSLKIIFYVSVVKPLKDVSCVFMFLVLKLMWLLQLWQVHERPFGFWEQQI